MFSVGKYISMSEDIAVDHQSFLIASCSCFINAICFLTLLEATNLANVFKFAVFLYFQFPKYHFCSLFYIFFVSLYLVFVVHVYLKNDSSKHSFLSSEGYKAWEESSLVWVTHLPFPPHYHTLPLHFGVCQHFLSTSLFL